MECAFRCELDFLSKQGEVSGCLANDNSFSSRWRAGQSAQIWPRPDRDDGCRPEPIPRRINSRRTAPWRLLLTRKLPEPTEAGFRVLPADRALCVVLDVCQNSPAVGGFLCGHATVFVEIERLVTHGVRSRQCAVPRKDRPS